MILVLAGTLHHAIAQIASQSATPEQPSSSPPTATPTSPPLAPVAPVSTLNSAAVREPASLTHQAPPALPKPGLLFDFKDSDIKFNLGALMNVLRDTRHEGWVLAAYPDPKTSRPLIGAGFGLDVIATPHPQSDPLNPRPFLEPSSAQLWQAAGLDSERLQTILDQFNRDLDTWQKKKFRKKIRTHGLTEQLSEQEATQLLRISAIQAIYNARAYCRWFDQLTASQQMALSQLVFQMGVNLEEFVQFLGAINDASAYGEGTQPELNFEHWKTVQSTLIESDWARRYSIRAIAVIAMFDPTYAQIRWPRSIRCRSKSTPSSPTTTKKLTLSRPRPTKRKMILPVRLIGNLTSKIILYFATIWDFGWGSSGLVKRPPDAYAGRPPGELHRTGEVGLAGCGQHRHPPGFVLQERLDLKVFADAQHCRQAPVPLRAASGDKVVRDLGIAHGHLNTALRAEVVRAPRLVSLAFAANPVAHQVTVVEIDIVVHHFPIDEVAAHAVDRRRIGVDRLGAEVELGQAGKVRQVDARIHRRASRSADWRHVVMYQRIAVQGEPAPQEWQTVGEVEAGMARAGIFAGKLYRRSHVVEAGKRVPEAPEGDGDVAFTAEDVIAREPELQILCRLKADLLPEDVRTDRELVSRE